MKQNKKSHVTILLFFFVMVSASFAQGSSSNLLLFIDKPGERTIDGQILFAPIYSTTTYLIDRAGAVDHTWSSAYNPNACVYWLGNGTILRAISSGEGGVQKILWNGTPTWDYKYTESGCTAHHDIKYLPNGNVLMIVFEIKIRADAIIAGRNPNQILSGKTFWSDKIIEVKPTGPTSGDVVWEWHAWDHLIQDYDPSEPNYGIVGDHPELIDINFGDQFGYSIYDWLHINSLDYNPQFNQILIDVHNFDEVWVIDHSTTTEEAAGHTGGHYGHGGDLLYRWGNPQAYRRGNSSDEKLFGQHDATWIPSGYPGAGDILVFNNGYNRPGTKYSSVDEFIPPINSSGWYALGNGSVYGPKNFSWDYTADPPTTFYSKVFGSALRLKDGDTLICNGQGEPATFFEVTPDGTMVWQYTNPYPSLMLNDVFKIDYIPPEKPPNPPIITGPVKAKIKNAVVYNLTTTNPDGDSVFYFIDWGDHTNSSWIGPYSSGAIITQLHTWTTKGTYIIKVKAKDIYNAESSNWSTLEVVMSLSYELQHLQFLAWLFNWFPHAFPILRQLISS